MDIKLIAFDLDGTLLDDHKEIPEANVSALAAAAEKGILIVPASGRIYRYMPEPVRSLPSARYFITTNGGAVCDAQAGCVIYSAQIPLERALQVFDHMKALDVLYDCYADNTRYTERSFAAKADDYFTDPLMNAMLHSYILKTRQETDDLRAFVTARNGPVQKMQMYFRDREERLRQLKLLPELFSDLAISTSLPNNIEINSSDATKGKALAALCKYLGIHREETMAFGDGLNDLDMMQFAGISVAMDNADPLIKESASYVTASNNEAGIAKALEHFNIV